jgi:penicillin-binding protein 2
VAFAPVGAPRYVCAAIVEHGGEAGGGGSAVAAPICRDVLIEVQRRDPARRVPQPDAVAEGRPSQVPVPAPAPLPVAPAARRG